MTLQMQPGGLLMPGAARPKHHPLANLFPMLSDDHRESFRNSLAQQQNHPIVLHRGMILDGRNRERELVELQKPVAYVVFTGTDRQALDLVIAENLERRHLTESQRGALAVKLRGLKLGDNQHTRQHAPIGAPSFDLGSQPSPETATEESSAGLSQSERADMVSVSRRTVQRADEVAEKGVPELMNAVESGKIRIGAAVEIASLPIEEQRAIIAAADPKVVKEVSKKNRTEKQAAGRDRRLKNMAKGDATPLLDGGTKVGVFYVDIPREFVAWSDVSGAEKSPENHYRVETFQFLADLRDKILKRAEDNCVIFMWAWANSLQDQLDLLAEWGFASVRRRDEAGRMLRDADGRILPPAGEGRYRTHQIWAKRSANGNLHQGMGFWFRDCHEVLLVGARGDVPAPLQGTQALSILDAVIGAHSEKPNDKLRDQIDHYFPGVRKLEMFGRVDDVEAFKARHPDWEVFGNGVEGGLLTGLAAARDAAADEIEAPAAEAAE